MPRRNRSNFHPAWLIGAVVFLLVAFFIGNHFFSQASDPYRTTAPLEVDAYLENSNSLRGNTYRIEGEILNVLAYSPGTQDRLISVGIDGNSAIIPLVIPNSLSHVNIQKGQRFNFQIEVDSGGILRARAMTKS